MHKALTFVRAAPFIGAIAVLLVGHLALAQAQPGHTQQIDPGLIVDDLGRDAPYYRVVLTGARPDSGITLLEGVGVLQEVGESSNCHGKQLRLELTEKGLRIAAVRGWDSAFGILRIPVGRFVYVRDSQDVKSDIDPPFVLFKVRFEGNLNAKYLPTLGPASSWNLTSLPEQYLTLDDVDKTLLVRIPLVVDGSRFVPDPNWQPGHGMLCSD
jgi:hypothetical protein